MAIPTGKQSFIPQISKLVVPLHLYSVYENRHGLILDYIGRAEAVSPAEAFKLVISRRYKLNIENEATEFTELTDGVCQVIFRETDYRIKRK